MSEFAGSVAGGAELYAGAEVQAGASGSIMEGADKAGSVFSAFSVVFGVRVPEGEVVTGQMVEELLHGRGEDDE